MIRSKFRILFLVFILGTVSCNDPLENLTEFNLRINNQTETEYKVFRAASEISGARFIEIGTVGPMDVITIRRLIIDVQYTFRLAPGEDPEEYDFQQVIQSTGDNITWSVP